MKIKSKKNRLPLIEKFLVKVKADITQPGHLSISDFGKSFENIVVRPSVYDDILNQWKKGTLKNPYIFYWARWNRRKKLVIIDYVLPNDPAWPTW